MSQPHFLLVTFPAQGHINPALSLARRLAGAGALVTFAASVSSYRRMISNATAPAGLTFATFSDGFDDGFKPSLSSSSSPESESDRYMSEMKRCASTTLTRIIEENRIQGRPFTCVVHTPLLSWVSKLARDFHLPTVVLWVQPTTAFDIFYYYYHGYGDVIAEMAEKDPSASIKLPGLPPLRLRDLPSFVVPSNCNAFILSSIHELMESLKEETSPTVLVNTFEELELEALNSIPDFKMVAVGPLINPRTDSSGIDDQSRDLKNYMEWLDTKPASSVVYISFGTVAVLSKKQLEEISRGLIESRRPFLWVITDKLHRSEGEGEKEEDSIGNFRQELDELGMVVPWCDQVRVLKHKAVGCFVTHCGWNSTLESLVLGVPVVAYPQWTDQMTNAKLLEDCWRTGVRVKENGEGLVESREIRRCIEAVMAAETETAKEIRRNAAKWRDSAAEAVQEGGSSYNNLKVFVDCHVGSFSRSNSVGPY